jgi:hypothetical protein
MSLTIEYHDGAVTYISDRGYGLLRAEQDNALLAAARKEKRQANITIASGAGLIAAFGLLVAEALIRNS